LGHDAFAFLEKVGEDAPVVHHDVPLGVGYDECHGDAVGLALQAAFLDHAADAENLALRCLAGGNVGRRNVEGDVAVQRIEHERGNDADDGECAADQREFLVTGFHSVVLLSARDSARICRFRRAMVVL
jgi:hypothetical protein